MCASAKKPLLATPLFIPPNGAFSKRKVNGSEVNLRACPHTALSRDRETSNKRGKNNGPLAKFEEAKQRNAMFSRVEAFSIRPL